MLRQFRQKIRLLPNGKQIDALRRHFSRRLTDLPEFPVSKEGKRLSLPYKDLVLPVDHHIAGIVRLFFFRTDSADAVVKYPVSFRLSFIT